MDLVGKKPVLTSWKDIARYLGKGVRTVQRWERQLGLPVRRTTQERKSVVLAMPEEIDQWIQCKQFAGGRLDSPDRAALLLTLNELRSENRELRRQLELEREKHRRYPRPCAQKGTRQPFES
jgi:hypothetical protein